MNIDEHIATLEKKLADLETQIQSQPTMADILDKVGDLFHAFAVTIHCASYIDIPCECGHQKHYRKAIYCTNCGRKLNKKPPEGGRKEK